MPENTPDHAIPYPSPSDPIRGSTGDYILTDLRDLALGTDSAITAAVDTRAPVSHTHTQEQIEGLSAALASAGGTAQWGSVSGKPSAYPPSAHTHERLDLDGATFKLNPAGGFEQHAGGSRRWLVDGTGTLLEGTVPPNRVDGLAARLAALEYTSGRRKITSLIPGVVSGDLFALRNGALVSLEFFALKLTPQAGSFIDLGNVIPEGFRVSGDREFFDIPTPVTGSAAGPIRLRRVGALLIYGANNGEDIYGTVTYQTLNPPPTTPPGDPA